MQAPEMRSGPHLVPGRAPGWPRRSACRSRTWSVPAPAAQFRICMNDTWSRWCRHPTPSLAPWTITARCRRDKGTYKDRNSGIHTQTKLVLSLSLNCLLTLGKWVQGWGAGAGGAASAWDLLDYVNHFVEALEHPCCWQTTQLVKLTQLPMCALSTRSGCSDVLFVRMLFSLIGYSPLPAPDSPPIIAINGANKPLNLSFKLNIFPKVFCARTQKGVGDSADNTRPSRETEAPLDGPARCAGTTAGAACAQLAPCRIR